MPFPTPIVPFPLTANATLTLKKVSGTTVDNFGVDYVAYQTLTVQACLVQPDSRGRLTQQEGANPQDITLTGYLVSPKTLPADYKFAGTAPMTYTNLRTGQTMTGEATFTPKETPYHDDVVTVAGGQAVALTFRVMQGGDA
jgi:hypothetical protein